MGFSGTYRYSDSRWLTVDPDDEPGGSEPWLWVDVYDSDFATVRYSPTGAGTGVAYLNETPRSYFEDDEASLPTEPDREAAGLAEWWAREAGPASEDQRVAKRAEIAALLAADEDPEDEPEGDDLFAEQKARRFLLTMDLPLPEDLARLS